jgi:hypothetical protein
MLYTSICRVFLSHRPQTRLSGSGINLLTVQAFDTEVTRLRFRKTSCAWQQCYRRIFTLILAQVGCLFRGITLATASFPTNNSEVR